MQFTLLTIFVAFTTFIVQLDALPTSCIGIALIVDGKKLCPEGFKYNSKLDCCASPTLKMSRRHLASSQVICILKPAPVALKAPLNKDDPIEHLCFKPLAYNKEENCCALMDLDINFGSGALENSGNNGSGSLENNESIGSLENSGNSGNFGAGSIENSSTTDSN